MKKRFIVPPTKASSIKAQQQPKQNRPILNPKLNSLLLLADPYSKKNDIGDRHFERHAFFIEENWYIAANNKITPEMKEF